jgi:hypothetical protein
MGDPGGTDLLRGTSLEVPGDFDALFICQSALTAQCACRQHALFRCARAVEGTKEPLSPILERNGNAVRARQHRTFDVSPLSSNRIWPSLAASAHSCLFRREHKRAMWADWASANLARLADLRPSRCPIAFSPIDVHGYTHALRSGMLRRRRHPAPPFQPCTPVIWTEDLMNHLALCLSSPNQMLGLFLRFLIVAMVLPMTAAGAPQSAQGQR